MRDERVQLGRREQKVWKEKKEVKTSRQQEEQTFHVKSFHPEQGGEPEEETVQMFQSDDRPEKSFRKKKRGNF